MLRKTSKLIKAADAVRDMLPFEDQKSEAIANPEKVDKYPKEPKCSAEPSLEYETEREQDMDIEMLNLDDDDFIPSISQAQAYYNFQTRKW